MSLVSEINRTETGKNKTKKVATQIDNKLVELGGEQAINLADVPNKIGAMVDTYKKIAIGDLGNKGIQQLHIETIETNCDFEIKEFIIFLSSEPKGTMHEFYGVSSKYYNSSSMNIITCVSSAIKQQKPRINIKGSKVDFWLERTTDGMLQPLYLLQWIAIG